MIGRLQILTLMLVLGTPLVACAGAFWGASVINVPAGDKLYVRQTMSPTSKVLGVYKNGDDVAFTGVCKNPITGKGFDLENVRPPTRKHRYSLMKAPNVWCQVWLETPAGSGKFDAGWVRGKFLNPP